MDDVKNISGIKIVGLQPRKVKIAGTVLSMTILCDCGSTDPIIIPNVNTAGVCLQCKGKYVIALYEFKNDSGLVTINESVARWNGPTHAMSNLNVNCSPAVGD